MWSLDLLTGERQARSDCQLRQAVITRTEKKKLLEFATRKEPLPLILAVGVSCVASRPSQEREQGKGTDRRRCTLLNRTFVTTPTRIHTFSLSHGDWQFLACPQALWKGNTFITTCDVDKHLLDVELLLLLLAWDSLHGLSLNLKVWICEGGRQTCEGVFPTIQI